MPEQMEDSKKPGSPPKVWRPMVLWTLALLALLGIVWLTVAVVAPVWQVRSCAVNSQYGLFVENGGEFVARHGSSSVIRSARIYLRLPDSIAPNKGTAIDLLGYCGPDAIAPLVKTLEDPYLSMFSTHALIRIGQSATPALLECLRLSTNTRARQSALETLCGLRPTPIEARRAVFAALADTELAFPASVLIARLSRDDPTFLPELEQALNNPNPQVRAAAAESFNYVRERGTPMLSSIEPLLTDTDELVRASACLAVLSCAGSQDKVLPVALPLLRSKNEQVVRFAISSVGRIGIPAKAAEPDLMRISNDQSQSYGIREFATNTLEVLRGKKPPYGQ